jgi:hypothetical protein
MYVCKAPYTLLVKLSDFTVWCHTWQENWVNCAVLTVSSTGLRTVLSSRISHRELHISFRESHSSLSLPADTTMASSRGTQPSKMNKREATLVFIETANGSLVLIHHSHMHKNTQNWQKNTTLVGNLCCAREHSVLFFVHFFFYTVKLHSLT